MSETFTVLIIGDKDLDGKLSTEFCDKEKDTKYYLYFDLGKHESNYHHGLYGRNYLQLLQPEIMQLYFNREYKVNKEIARKIFNQLVVNGWIDKEIK